MNTDSYLYFHEHCADVEYIDKLRKSSDAARFTVDRGYPCDHLGGTLDKDGEVIAAAVRKKMKVNEIRQWIIDGYGISRHI